MHLHSSCCLFRYLCEGFHYIYNTNIHMYLANASPGYMSPANLIMFATFGAYAATRLSSSLTLFFLFFFVLYTYGKWFTVAITKGKRTIVKLDRYIRWHGSNHSYRNWFCFCRCEKFCCRKSDSSTSGNDRTKEVVRSNKMQKFIKIKSDNVAQRIFSTLALS